MSRPAARRSSPTTRTIRQKSRCSSRWRASLPRGVSSRFSSRTATLERRPSVTIFPRHSAALKSCCSFRSTRPPRNRLKVAAPKTSTANSASAAPRISRFQSRSLFRPSPKRRPISRQSFGMATECLSSAQAMSSPSCRFLKRPNPLPLRRRRSAIRLALRQWPTSLRMSVTKRNWRNFSPKRRQRRCRCMSWGRGRTCLSRTSAYVVSPCAFRRTVSAHSSGWTRRPSVSAAPWRARAFCRFCGTPVFQAWSSWQVSPVALAVGSR